MKGQGVVGSLDMTSDDLEGLRLNKGWRIAASVKLSCFAEAGADMSKITAPIVLESDGPLLLQIQNAEIVSNTGSASCSLR